MGCLELDPLAPDQRPCRLCSARAGVPLSIDEQRPPNGISLQNRGSPDRHEPAWPCALFAGLRLSAFNHPDSFSAKEPILLARLDILNFGSTESDRRFLRMVFRDRPVRRAIFRIGRPSWQCQRRITLKNAMSNTPDSPAQSDQDGVQTWIKFSVKTSPQTGSGLRGNQQDVVSTITSSSGFRGRNPLLSPLD